MAQKRDLLALTFCRFGIHDKPPCLMISRAASENAIEPCAATRLYWPDFHQCIAILSKVIFHSFEDGHIDHLQNRIKIRNFVFIL